MAILRGVQQKKLFAYSVYVWVIPFVISVPFFDRNGQLRTSEYWFKCVMAIFSSWCTAVALRSVLPSRTSSLNGMLVASEIVAINWALDLLVFVHFGLGGYTLYTYFEKIGCGYLAGIAMGWLAGGVSSDAAINRKKST
ncbi:hypothetical protein SARC_12131 [Sphaeroforma arctica JP610]|uniref:Uncharacterized protein n=1 Tax=Sphaeroforma arctica JP610 TaxID=667725 RepID=A0A0L0FEY9_9EUKA|nr:hypothetical protein SARC_12131 [Sphaeroforma arctica JP610]KNC75342.1 hypothetical protein SARC_12131 [Sphaeroforma arctica JP610]|eukprot:XP_014149244.1 hypothetical protein SARC_12131 [Sphaeroforma arctica JP610]